MTNKKVIKAYIFGDESFQFLANNFLDFSEIELDIIFEKNSVASLDDLDAKLSQLLPQEAFVVVLSHDAIADFEDFDRIFYLLRFLQHKYCERKCLFIFNTMRDDADFHVEFKSLPKNIILTQRPGLIPHDIDRFDSELTNLGRI